MRMKLSRNCVALLYLLVQTAFFTGCSSTQQQEGYDDYEMEAEQGEVAQGEAQAEYENEQGDETNSYNEEESLGENAGENGYNYNEGGEELVNEIQQSENYLAGEEGAEGAAEETAYGSNTYNEAGGEELVETVVDGAEGYTEGEDPVSAEPLNASPTDVPNNAVAMTESAPAAAAGLPQYGAKMPYVVQRGDTLGKIAQMIYGDREKWAEIAELTALSNPNRIYPGDVIYYQLTDASNAFATSYESRARSEYVVNDGDTLASIAGQVLGNPSDWKQIWRENDKIANPDQLISGMVVYYVNAGAMTAALEQKGSAQTAQVEVLELDIQDVDSSKNIEMVETEVQPEFKSYASLQNVLKNVGLRV